MQTQTFSQTFITSPSFTLKALLTSVALLTTLSACQTTQGHTSKKQNKQENTLYESSLASQVVRGPKMALPTNETTERALSGPQIGQTESQVGYVPVLAERPDDDEGQAGPPPKVTAKKINAFVRPLPVPEFIDAVFGGMLETPYVTGPNVATMDDIVQMRSSGEMKAVDFFSLVSAALEQYGVRIVSENGAYQLIEDASLRARIPQFIKSRARERTRSDLRPIVQFVEMQAVSAINMVEILNQAYGRNNKKLQIKANGLNNYVVLSGLPQDVDEALKIIRELDELDYAGSQVRRYTPRYWNVTEFSQQLEKALNREGWQVTSNKLQTRTIALLPVEYSNDLFIFVRSAEANERVTRWLQELDRPVEGGDTEQIFIYQVKNVDATLLAETANSAVQGQSSGAGAGTLQRANSTAQSTGSGAASFTVDPMGNRIIFTGTANDYDKLINLLEQLDTPAPEVLIEVQIAEVTLNDSMSSGVDFFIDDIGSESVGATASTNGGLTLGASGLSIAVLSGNVDASINAFASNRRVKVLSTPVIVARSGGSAQLQVGSDVPIITSQSAASSSVGGTSDILQTVEYRSTGVLLSIEPIVFSDNRIDLTLSQEVSSTLDVANSTISSPTISSRTLNTQLSLEDGATAVLGGLIQENVIRDEQGIPFLKDLPGIGQIFSVDSYSVDRTELVILITAYVLRGQSDKTQFVNSMRNRIDGVIADESRLVTLKPKQF